MKGIILAGGKGTRLGPLTKSISKQMLPIYDKPMIYYPLSVLLMAGIRDILLISTRRDIILYQNLLDNGNQLGINIEYKIQEEPKGLAEAFIIGENFIGKENVCLILGDNIFYGQGFQDKLNIATSLNNEAYIFGYPIEDPREFGVVEFDKQYNVLSIEEKPLQPKSNYAVPGLYFYDNSVVEMAKNIKPSTRGELEITDINNIYLKQKKLKVILLGRGFTWLDTGNPTAMLQASNFIETIQKRQGFYIACIEEIAWRKRWITDRQLLELGKKLEKTDYGKYILQLLTYGEKDTKKNK